MPQSSAEVAAQSEYYQRHNGPVIGADPTFKTQPQKLLRQYQKHGHIPKRFKSWAEINEEFKQLVEIDGLSEEQAREQIGITRRNPNNKPIISVYDRYEKGNYINARNINEDWNPEAEDYVRRIKGEDAVEQERLRQRDSWGDNKIRLADRPYGPAAPNAKDDTDRVKEKMSENIGLTADTSDRARQVHRGHGGSASQYAAGSDQANLDPEPGPQNVHGHAGVPGNPRFHPDVMADRNMPTTTDSAYWANQLEEEGLTLTPRSMRQAGDAIAADEWQEIHGKKPNGDYIIGPSKDPVRYPAESMVAREDLRYQLQQQGVSGARAQADSQSTLLDTTDATAKSGPVRTVQPKNRSVTVQDTKNRTETGRLRKPQTRYLDSGVQTRSVKPFRGVMKYAPFVSGAMALGGAFQSAKAGDYMGATGHLIGGAVSEVPVVGDSLVEAGQGTAAYGSLEDAKRSAAIVRTQRQQKPTQYGYHGPDVPKPKPTYQKNRDKLNANRRSNKPTTTSKPNKTTCKVNRRGRKVCK